MTLLVKVKKLSHRTVLVKKLLRLRSVFCWFSIYSIHLRRCTCVAAYRVSSYPPLPRCLKVMGNACLALGSGLGAFSVVLAPAIRFDDGRLAIPTLGVVSSEAETTKSSRGMGWNPESDRKRRAKLYHDKHQQQPTLR